MKRSTQSLIILLLVRMVRRGGPLRWLAVGLVLLVVGVAYVQPDLLNSGTAGGAKGPRSTVAPAERSATDAEVTDDATFDDSSAAPEQAPEAAPEAPRSTREARRTLPQEDRSASTAAPDRPLLEELRGGVLRSPAGLLYTRGSEQGHRLKHVLAHTHDEPNRPGAHGVFRDGSEDAVVGLIDEAYRRAQSGRDTQREDDEGRSVLTVDMGRPIGYLGGQTGQRRGHPSARHLRIVLEQERVITAYPIIP